VRYRPLSASLGGAPSAAHHDCLHFRLSRIAKLRRHLLPGHGVRRDASLATLPPSLSEGSGSLINNANPFQSLFPRLIVPASSVIVSFVDFAVSMVLFGAPGVLSRLARLALLALPLFTLFALRFGRRGNLARRFECELTATSGVVPFIVQLALYFAGRLRSAIVLEKWRILLHFNPMVGVIDGFRWSISKRWRAPFHNKACSCPHYHRPACDRIWYFRKNGTHVCRRSRRLASAALP
jgi:lipopolysaccharide transport system permease protein